MKQAPKTQPLNTKARGRICLIIDPKKGQPIDTAMLYLKAVQQAILSYSRFTFRATIIHDKDINDDGTPKQMHVHAVCEFLDNGETLKDMLAEVCDLVDAKPEQISIQTSNNAFLIVQYLKHNGKPDKYQYDDSLILTNNEEELKARLHQEYTKPVDPVAEAVKETPDLMALIEAVGLEKANKYRGLWKDIHGGDLLMLRANYNKLLKKFEDLYELYGELIAEINRLRQENGKCRSIRLEYFQSKYELLDL